MACCSSDDEVSCCNDSKHTKFSYFGPRLVPFLKTACIYMILVPEINPPNVVVAILKCLPTLSLCIFVLWYDGFSFTSKNNYSRRILGGLLLSMLGDICLVYADEGYFLHGVAAFGLAHIMYIFAFGFYPLRASLYLKLSPISFLIYWYIYNGLSGIALKVAVLMYILLILFMNWRALAKIKCLGDVRDGVNGKSHKKWTELVACLGAISFCVSDACLAINRFHSDVPHQRWIVMTTYYLAQLGFALSVVKHREIKRRKLMRKKTDSVTPAGSGMDISAPVPVIGEKDKSE
uniref:lysoplasmalogenase n=1 Tax=Phallusia mammillata TaxID=59560 RepID=A0A6F9DUJ1_9ASCI|nr:lysoplasmalogenase-like protein TMEM86A [Phallusia mammillata]